MEVGLFIHDEQRLESKSKAVIFLVSLYSLHHLWSEKKLQIQVSSSSLTYGVRSFGHC